MKECMKPVVIPGFRTGTLDAACPFTDRKLELVCTCLSVSLRTAARSFDRSIACEGPNEMVKNFPMRVRDAFHSDSP